MRQPCTPPSWAVCDEGRVPNETERQKPPAKNSMSFCCAKAAPKIKAEDILSIGHSYVERDDGRLVEYLTCGDPNGVPVVLNHGFMRTCMFAKLFDASAKENGIRLLCASLPGFGLSDSYPLGVERSILEWPLDVGAVLAAEHVESFHLLGFSAGCMHAAAVAHCFPTRALNVMFVAPPCPMDGSVDFVKMGMSPKAARMRAMLTTPIIKEIVGKKLGKLAETPMLFLEQTMPGALLALKRLGKERPADAQTIREDIAFSVKNSYRGIVDNFAPLNRSPPFRLSELSHTERKIAVAFTSDDDLCPPGVTSWFHNQIPGSVLQEYPSGWGHLFLTQNTDAFLKFLVDERAI